MAKKKKKRFFLYRLLTIAIGVILILLAKYAYENTSERNEVLNDGSMVSGVISKIHSGRDRIIYVTVNRVQFDAGFSFGKYNHAAEGDSVNVHFKGGSKYVVLEGTANYTATILLQFMLFVFGVALIVIGIFYNGQKTLKF